MEQMEQVQLVARGNNKHPGDIIFVREDGKVGFPSMNSVHVVEGDVIHGIITKDTDNYFFVEVQEVVSKSQD